MSRISIVKINASQTCSVTSQSLCSDLLMCMDCNRSLRIEGEGRQPGSCSLRAKRPVRQHRSESSEFAEYHVFTHIDMREGKRGSSR